MAKNFLPIGSVVILNGGTKPVMINGYCAVTESLKDKVFDYRGCPFPEGVLDSKGVALFDNDQIKEIVFEGYDCDETKEFLKKLEKIVNGDPITEE